MPKFLVFLFFVWSWAAVGDVMHMTGADWSSCTRGQRLCYSLAAQDAGQSYFSKNIYARDLQLRIVSNRNFKKVRVLNAQRGIWLADGQRWLLSCYNSQSNNVDREYYFYPDTMRLENIRRIR